MRPGTIKRDRGRSPGAGLEGLRTRFPATGLRRPGAPGDNPRTRPNAVRTASFPCGRPEPPSHGASRARPAGRPGIALRPSGLRDGLDDPGHLVDDLADLVLGDDEGR